MSPYDLEGRARWQARLGSFPLLLLSSDTQTKQMAYLIRQAKQKMLADGVPPFHEDRKQKASHCYPSRIISSSDESAKLGRGRPGAGARASAEARLVRILPPSWLALQQESARNQTNGRYQCLIKRTLSDA